VVETPKAPLGLTSSKVSMNNLTRFDSEGIEIFINEAGESFSSISGAARMAGKSASTISRLAALRNFKLQHTQIDTASGSKTVALLDEDQIVEVLEKYNPSRLKQFAKLGIRTALHQIAGYSQQPIASQQKPLDIYNLDAQTIWLLISEMYWRLTPDKADFERFNGNDGLATKEEVDTLDERLKNLSPMLNHYICSLYSIRVNKWPEKAPKEFYIKIVMQMLTNPVLVEQAQQFQAQLDRTQLEPAASQKQIASI
jgi:hypothetical protein